MTRNKRSWISLLVSLFFFCGLLLWAQSAQSGDVYASIQKNLTILGNIFKEVSHRYVDEVDPDRFLKAGIDGMLGTLDPYTVYIEKEDQHQLRVLTQGKYGGVGIPLNYRNSQVTVSESPFLGTPASRAGIREGDIIIKVDSVYCNTLSFDKAAEVIRGPVGTEVTLTIRRQGEDKPLEFKLIREQIVVEDIRYAGFVEEGIGYIRLTRFSQNAAPEILQAVRNFKAQDLKGLIIDLRSNPGGVLDAAVDVSDIFLQKEKPIVSTRGRTPSSVRSFKSFRDPAIGDIPLVILVNRFSASASEIVAGAIQDNDRGVVMGDTTFGKGLVQSVMALSPTTSLKVTTAKYFTPSGRCIQSRNYSMWSDTTTIDTSTVFHTASGRPVHGGGGIAPDIVSLPPKVNTLVIDLRRKYQFFNFALKYTTDYPDLSESFTVDDNMLVAFKEYLKEKEYLFKYSFERSLDALKEEAGELSNGPDLVSDIDQLEATLQKTKETFFEESKDDIKLLIKQELTSKYHGTQAGVRVAINNDPVIKEAIELLNNTAEYQEVLSGDTSVKVGWTQEWNTKKSISLPVGPSSQHQIYAARDSVFHIKQSVLN